MHLPVKKTHLPSDNCYIFSGHLSETGSTISGIHIHFAIIIFTFLPCKIFMADMVTNKVVKMTVYRTTLKHEITLRPQKCYIFIYVINE